MDFRDTTVAEVAARVGDTSLSAREVIAATLDRIDRLDGELCAYAAVAPAAAVAEAAAFD